MMTRLKVLSTWHDEGDVPAYVCFIVKVIFGASSASVVGKLVQELGRRRRYAALIKCLFEKPQHHTERSLFKANCGFE